MKLDLENIDFELLSHTEKIEASAVLHSNINVLIVQLLKCKEPLLADILSFATTFRLANRDDLLLRTSQFGKELLRAALADQEKNIEVAKMLQRAIIVPESTPKLTEENSAIDELEKVN